MRALLSGVVSTWMFSASSYAKSEVQFKGDSIEIKLESRDKVILANNLKMGTEAGITYFYRGFYQSIGYHKVTYVAYEDHGSFTLINGKNGKRTEFAESEPILNELGWSTKYTPYLAATKDDYHGPSTLNIWTINDSIQWVWGKTLPHNNCWVFGKILWHDSTGFRVEKKVSKENLTSSSVFEKVSMKKGDWVLEDKWKTDLKCNWIISKHGSNQVKKE